MADLIRIKEFAKKTSMSYMSAWELSRSKEFLNNKISVKLNPLSKKKGGVRINWERYLEFIENSEEFIDTVKKEKKASKKKLI